MYSQTSYKMAKKKIEQALLEIGKKENGSKAVEIMNIISYFAPQNIPTKMFFSVVDGEEELGAAVTLLKGHSLVDSGPEETLLHVDEIVQQVIKTNLEIHKKEEDILTKALKILLQCSIDSSNLDHAMSIWNYLSQYRELINMSSGLASRIFNELGKHDASAAAIFGYLALHLLKDMTEENHFETLTLKHNISRFLGTDGVSKDGLELLQPLKDIKTMVKKEFLKVLVGILKRLYKKFLYREMLPIHRIILGNQQVSETSDETILNTWDGYGLALIALGKCGDGLEILVQLYKKRVKISGVENADALQTKSFIALGLVKQGRYPEALKIYQEVFNKRKRYLGEDHPDTLRIRRDIGATLQAEGRYDEAKVLNEQTAEKFKQVLGEKNQDTLSVQINLAIIFEIINKLLEAEKLYRDVYNKHSEFLGQKHFGTLGVKYHLALCLIKQKKTNEGLRYLQEVATMYNSILGPEHPGTLSINETIEALLSYINLLFTAVKRNEFKELPTLLQCSSSCPINHMDDQGYSLLHRAVSYEYRDIVNILLINGADVTQITNKGNTPLHIAVLKGHVHIVEILLQHASREKIINFIDAKTTASCTTSLHVAAKNGSVEIAKTLLKHGAIYNIMNKEAKTPFNVSNSQKVSDLLKLIKELFEAAEAGNTEVIGKLEALKPDEFVSATNARNVGGYTLLQVAVNKANESNEISSKLLKMLKSADKN